MTPVLNKNLAEPTRVHATVLRPSVCLSVTLCIVVNGAS